MGLRTMIFLSVLSAFSCFYQGAIKESSRSSRLHLESVHVHHQEKCSSRRRGVARVRYKATQRAPDVSSLSVMQTR